MTTTTATAAAATLCNAKLDTQHIKRFYCHQHGKCCGERNILQASQCNPECVSHRQVRDSDVIQFKMTARYEWFNLLTMLGDIASTSACAGAVGAVIYLSELRVFGVHNRKTTKFVVRVVCYMGMCGWLYVANVREWTCSVYRRLSVCVCVCVSVCSVWNVRIGWRLVKVSSRTTTQRRETNINKLWTFWEIRCFFVFVDGFNKYQMKAIISVHTGKII